MERCGQRDTEKAVYHAEIPRESVQNTKFYIIHGTEDQVVPCQESLKIMSYLRDNFTWGRKEPQLYLLDGTGHSGGGIRQELRRDRVVASLVKS